MKAADVWAGADGYANCAAKPRPKPAPVGARDSGASSVSSTAVTASGTSARGPRTCFTCGDPGHVKSSCPKNPAAFKDSEKEKKTVAHVSVNSEKCEVGDKYVVAGTVNGSWVSSILRDSGCKHGIIVSEKVTPDADISNADTICLSDYLGREDIFPLVKIYLRCPLYEGWTMAARAPLAHCAVVLGNVPGVKDLVDTDRIVEIEARAIDSEIVNEIDVEGTVKVETGVSSVKDVEATLVGGAIS